MKRPKDFGFGEDEKMLRDNALRFLGEHASNEKLRKLVATDPDAPLSRSLFEMQKRLAEFCGGFVQERVEAEDGVEARFKRHRLFL